MRRLLIALLLLCSLTLLGACGGATPAATPDAGDSGQGAEPTTEMVEPTEEMAEATEEMMEPTAEATEEMMEATPEATEETMEATPDAEATPAGGGEMSEDMGAMMEMIEAGEMGALTMSGDMLMVDAGGCEYGGFFETIEAVDAQTVVFTLCKSDPAFQAKIAFEGFGIHPMEHLMATEGSGDLLEEAIGTGPYKLDEWNRGESVNLVANEDYWGDAPLDPTMVFRWATEGAARLVEVQSGQVDEITFISPDDYEAVEGDENLQLVPINNPNIFYLGMTNTFEPFDQKEVRQAIAMGIDRQRIVDNFYPTGSTVADYFTPCSIPGGCEGDPWWEFNAEEARAMLEAAGVSDLTTNIYYRDVFRVYLPEPKLIAEEIQAQLQENLGITAEISPMESGPFLEASSAGELDGIYLLGWGADYPHPTNFLDYHFGEANTQFGEPFAEIYEPLVAAAQLADAEEAAELYAEANNAIRDLVPMIPIANGAAANAALATAEGINEPPFGATFGELVDTEDDTFVYMQAAEPISLYCNDETDGETFRVCAQIFDSLLAYSTDSGDTVPALATECTGNEDATEWTCNLREDVVFHDGSTFDANDVVFTYAVGVDAANPYHTGSSGVFEYWSYLWGLINAPEAPAE